MSPPSSHSAVEFLFSLQSRGMKFGLRNIRLLVADMDNPHEAFPAVHIAGTNGKGSTSAFIASILTELGLRVGLYTSPHLVNFTERIRIDGREIAGRRVTELTKRFISSIRRHRATFFEATTALAFRYFADERVDIAVVETGLGGRLDATNVLTPLVSAVTSIGLDHRETLGSTVEAIAAEKSGIIKPRVPVAVSSRDRSVRRVLADAARRAGSRLWASERIRCATGGQDGAGRIIAEFEAGFGRTGQVRLGLSGKFQLENARLAVAVSEILRTYYPDRFGSLNGPTVRRGLCNVVHNTGLRGRLESIRGTRIVLDVAHNPDAVWRLVREARGVLTRHPVILFGVMSDKDFPSMLLHLGRLRPIIVAVEPHGRRSLEAGRIQAECARLGIPAIAGGGVAGGLRIARRLADSASLLITGSHYVVGEALMALRKEGIDC